MRRNLLLSLVLCLALAVLAQEENSESTEAQATEGLNKRIITIDFSGGRQSSENLRFGPLFYEHDEPEGIVSTVSNLTIYSQNAELRAPEGVLIAQSDGQREAFFRDGVRVTRGRLEATGPELAYSEVTGLGDLTGQADIEIAPRDEGDNPVMISTDEVEFDVDTDVSTSHGNVNLVNGNQTAEADVLIFEEERDLGKLTCDERLCSVTREDEDGDILTITAPEIRVLTELENLYATGGVTVVDGDITTTGDEVFFEDESSRALVFGSPAVSEDEANGSRTTGAVLEQRTDIDAVRVYSGEVEFSRDDFQLIEETD